MKPEVAYPFLLGYYPHFTDPETRWGNGGGNENLATCTREKQDKPEGVQTLAQSSVLPVAAQQPACTTPPTPCRGPPLPPLPLPAPADTLSREVSAQNRTWIWLHREPPSTLGGTFTVSVPATEGTSCSPPAVGSLTEPGQTSMGKSQLQ